jgi:magnesium chelatase family protein
MSFSCKLLSLAAMNPCPCGNLFSDQKPCSCAPATATNRQKRISGLLLDRIDIHIEVPRVDYEMLSTDPDRVGESSVAIRARVQAACDIQAKCFSNHGSSEIVCTADMRVGEIRQFCWLQDEGQSLMWVAIWGYAQLNLWPSMDDGDWLGFQSCLPGLTLIHITEKLFPTDTFLWRDWYYCQQ